MWLLALAAVYVGAGVAFAAWFVTAGAERLDAAVKGAGIGFRILITPGSMALWPYLLLRTLRSKA